MSWVSEQQALMASLAGVEITSIRAVEMAVADVGADGRPSFRNERLPFVQCHVVELALLDGRIARFSNYQNDSVFGVMLEFRASSSIEAHWNDAEREGEASIYRIAADSDWPSGLIARVDTRLRDGDISEVELKFADCCVVLKAGEVCEQRDGSLTVNEMDESILLFPDARDVARVSFMRRGV